MMKGQTINKWILFIFYFNCDYCVGITKVKIYVTWFMRPHLCLLGCSYCLSICWSGYHLILREKGVAKVCAIHLWHGGEHMFSNRPLDDLWLLFNVKLYIKCHVPSHVCLYHHNESRAIIGVILMVMHGTY
jgi:hypothetical protein